MSDCGRRIKWAGGEHEFDLGNERVLAMLRADGMVPAPTAFLLRGYVGKAILDGQFGGTPAACLKRFDQGVYSVSDVERIIELGLYGGGLTASDAVDLVDAHVRGKPLAENAVIAYEVLAALFVRTSDASTSA